MHDLGPCRLCLAEPRGSEVVVTCVLELATLSDRGSCCVVIASIVAELLGRE